MKNVSQVYEARRKEAAKRAAIRAASDVAAKCDYAPGYFTALIRRHNWPPRFEAKCQPSKREQQVLKAAKAGRDKAKQEQVGWGDGTIAGLRIIPRR